MSYNGGVSIRSVRGRIAKHVLFRLPGKDVLDKQVGPDLSRMTIPTYAETRW